MTGFQKRVLADIKALRRRLDSIERDITRGDSRAEEDLYDADKPPVTPNKRKQDKGKDEGEDFGDDGDDDEWNPLSG